MPGVRSTRTSAPSGAAAQRDDAGAEAGGETPQQRMMRLMTALPSAPMPNIPGIGGMR